MANEYDLSCDAGTELALCDQEVFALCDLVLHAEGVTRPCMVSVSAVSDERMRALNLAWRGKDLPTDVLSLECEGPNDPDLAVGEPCELGDIVLAPAYVARQAALLHTSAADETRLLIVHGMLHLLGYDHLEDGEAQLMESREDELLRLARTDARLGHVALTRHRGVEAL